MKTKEQIKNEVVNYLTKTCNHIFMITKSNEEHFFKVTIINGDFYEINIKNNIYSRIKIEIDKQILYYESNAKNVIKNNLFLNKGMRSIKKTNYIKNKFTDNTPILI